MRTGVSLTVGRDDAIAAQPVEAANRAVGEIALRFANGVATVYLTTEAAARLVAAVLPHIPAPLTAHVEVDNGPTGEVPPDYITTSDGTRYVIDPSERNAALRAAAAGRAL